MRCCLPPSPHCGPFLQGRVCDAGGLSTKKHIDIAEYVHPDVFEEYRIVGLEKGFDYVESGPMVRSSYHAERHVHPQRG